MIHAIRVCSARSDFNLPLNRCSPFQDVQGKKDQGDFAKWRSESSRLRSALNMPRDAKPWTGRAGVELRGVPNKEHLHDLLDIAFEDRRSKFETGTPTSDVVRGFMADLSQAVGRKAWSDGPGTARKNSIWYSFEYDCVLSGSCNMRLLGWGERFCESFSESELRNLAGEGYSLPIAAVLTLLFYCNPHAIWWA